MRTLNFTALISDAFDGAMRLLNDAQRFGFAILRFDLNDRGTRGVSVEMTLLVPADTDADLVATRLARHAAVLSIEPVDHEPGDAGHDSARSQTNARKSSPARLCDAAQP